MLGVDIRGALNLVGSVVRYLSLAFLLPAAIAVGYGEAVWPFLLSGALTFAFGASLEHFTEGRDRIGAREGYVVVSLIWLLIALFGALPYVLAEPQLSNPIDALFESMSGFSTTGASVVADVRAMARSMEMWRQFTAWIGGVGIIVLFVAVFPRLRIGGRQVLFKAESAGPELALAETIRESAKRFVVLYLSITVVEVAILGGIGLAGFDDRMSLYNAVALASSTVATAGFTPEPRSLEGFAPVTQWVLVVFMLVAGTNFALLYVGIVGRQLGLFRRDEEFRVGLALFAAASFVVVIALISEGTLEGEEAIRNGVFNTVSMMTTTGFASDDFGRWTALTSMVLVGVTLIGASAGSTSGSIKIVRHIVIAKMLRREIDQTLHPGVVVPLRVQRAVVDERALRAVIVFVFLYLGVCAAGAMLILFDSELQGVPLTAFEAVADAAAALGGAGSGLGFAGPMGSFEPFSNVSTVVLTLLMYLGRLEIIPVLVLFTASHWRA